MAIVVSEKRGIFEINIETQLLYDRLVTAEVDEVITYAELSRIAGYVVQERRGSLYTARKMALRDNNMVFDTVMNEGVRLLDDTRVVNSGAAPMKRIGNITRNAARRLTAVDFEGLSNEDRVKHNSLLSVYGAIRHFSKPRSLRRIESRVQQDYQRLSLLNTLREFTGDASAGEA